MQKNQSELKYQLLIKKYEQTTLKHFAYFKTVIKYSNGIKDAYPNIDDHSPNEKGKILIVFDDMIADILCNKNLNQYLLNYCYRQKTECFYLFCYTIILLVRLNSTH